MLVVNNNALFISKLQIDYLLFYWHGLSEGYLNLFKLKVANINWYHPL